MHFENERRFLVLRMNKHILRSSEKQHIVQGYFDLAFPSFTDFRVRIIDGKKAILGIKKGFGVSRRENEIEINLSTAHFLLAETAYIIHKIRYTPKEQPENEKWSIDIFEEVLKGITMVEVEMNSPDQKISWPKWLKRAVEVTNSVTNLHLARLSADLSGPSEIKTPIKLYNLIPKSIPRIVLTGGPGSGKSSIMKIIAKEKKNTLHCVPEVATILINQVGISPKGSKLKARQFNKDIYRIQRIFEATSTEESTIEGKRAIVLDRGTVDNATYFEGGLKEFESYLQTNRNIEYSQYGLVIFLGMPSEEIYEKYKENNPARTETYKQAVARSEKIKQIWQEHPNFRAVENQEDWQEKLRNVEKIIDEFLNQKTAEN